MDKLRRALELIGSAARRLASAVLVLPTVVLLLESCGAGPATVSPTAPPPWGSVVLEDGRCCVAAVAGEEVTIEADFQAANATEMRTGSALHTLDEAKLAEFPWEPFAPTRLFVYEAPINWTGFFVTVQFRNASGTLSPIYSDDISVEGMPGPYPLSTP